MFKKSIIFAVLLLATATVNAQQFDDAPANEISVSYGFAPITELASDFGDLFSYIFSAGYYTTDNAKSIGAINIDYTHKLNRWLNVGVNANYSELKHDVFFNKTLTGCSDKKYYTVMPTAKFNWFRRKYVSMYSRVSLGVTVGDITEENESEHKSEHLTRTYFMAHVSPFGIEAGSNNIRAFYEVGLGQAGVAQLGVRARF